MEGVQCLNHGDLCHGRHDAAGCWIYLWISFGSKSFLYVGTNFRSVRLKTQVFALAMVLHRGGGKIASSSDQNNGFALTLTRFLVSVYNTLERANTIFKTIVKRKISTTLPQRSSRRKKQDLDTATFSITKRGCPEVKQVLYSKHTTIK